MRIVHGTWFPDETSDFVQRGSFCIWVEIDTPANLKLAAGKPSKPGAEHPRHLTRPGLTRFLQDTFKLGGSDPSRLSNALVEKHVLLPSVDGRPLPSFELAPYLEDEIPADFELSPWQVWCYRLPDVISDLNTIQYIAQSAAEEFQLGHDLQFWQQHAQAIKGIIARDQYIPSLTYHETTANGKRPTKANPDALLRPGQRSSSKSRKAKSRGFEVRGGWEFVSARYESLIERHAAAMPLACAAGATGPDDTTLYNPEPLLRHFSECLLYEVVTDTPITAAFEKQIADTLVSACLFNGRRAPLKYSYAGYTTPVDDRTEATIVKEYEQWLTWRQELTRTHTGAGFTLCFRLDEASPTDPDDWHVQFLVAARNDPSRRLSLDEYWALAPKDRARAAKPFGDDFERQVLIGLGSAARIYPTIWEGLATDQPTGVPLTLDGAFSFLKESAWVLEDAGFTVMVPAWWTPQGRRRARVRLRTSARSSNGSTATPAASRLSMESLISYQYQLSIGGQPVTEQEWRQLVNAKTPLVQFRGQWMELDREKMQEMLAFWQKQQREEPELDLIDVLRLEAEAGDDLEWEHDDVVEEMLARLQDKSALQPIENPAALQGTLRDYQRRGVAWMQYLEGLGLNACLADDMGLGKTIQVISRLLMERESNDDLRPTLIIAPTSVLGNWRKEIERFGPDLRVLVHQGGARAKSEKDFKALVGQHDVVLTSFTLARLDEKLLRAAAWHRVVVDEAQNIKNPGAAQTKAILKLSAPHRLALTGTPVENRLRDLWSIFNFLSPGYLGKEAQFRKSFEVPIYKEHDPTRSATLKRLAEPFILRRLKTDKRIIDDLPDKIEQTMFTTLSPEQASLYEAVVKDVERKIEELEGIERRGLILATLMRLKQICNHPAQFLADGSPFTPERSHKLARLAEMVEEVIESGESALIFTQFTEIGEALERFLGHTKHYQTYYLHGGTSAARREKLVSDFQDPESPPGLFILSLRAGGVGLNLTRANHVFHFDRWWNPAVEDQATDRAFRIGQRKNVFVHKFVALGTMEEKIDALIEDKKKLSSLVVGTDEGWLTELDNETFRDLIALRTSAVVD
jgi:SNF2 family DNA or RNA helicase